MRRDGTISPISIEQKHRKRGIIHYSNAGLHVLDKQTEKSLTNALDAAIVATASTEFGRLSKGLSDEQVAKKIHGALRSLERLQSGDMPEYDEWTALFYLLWYQPERVNLAYTLTKRRLDWDNNHIRESAWLEATDFGCGQLAMQFGLALAAADAPATTPGVPPALTVTSSDASQPMLLLGRRLWDRFMREITIGRNPDLGEIRRVCNGLRFAEASGAADTARWIRYSTENNRASKLENVRWLTALHVAYEEVADDVMEELDGLSSKIDPDLILVTTHPISSSHAYRPTPEFSEFIGEIGSEQLELKGEFSNTTTLRKRLFYEQVDSASDGLTDEEQDFVQKYMTILPTSWVTRPSFESYWAVYTRQRGVK